MQTKSSDSDHCQASNASWIPRRSSAPAGRTGDKIVMLNDKPSQARLKPGLY
jgi:hypothetical protein